MADFCTNCSNKMFGENVDPEIDISAIFKKLESGNYLGGYLCEGCDLVAVAKTDEGKLQVAYLGGDKWQNYSMEIT